MDRIRVRVREDAGEDPALLRIQQLETEIKKNHDAIKYLHEFYQEKLQEERKSGYSEGMKAAVNLYSKINVEHSADARNASSENLSYSITDVKSYSMGYNAAKEANKATIQQLTGENQVQASQLNAAISNLYTIRALVNNLVAVPTTRDLLIVRIDETLNDIHR